MLNSFAKCIAALLFVASSSAAMAQDVRYSWFEIAYVEQEVGRNGTVTDSLLGQTVDISAKDGNGIKFRGSVGTWHNLFALVDYNSSDIRVDAAVSNSQGQFLTTDEFDFTAVRSGVGLKWSLTPKTDLYGAVTYDNVDLDFGSFAGENFDVDNQDIGATVGVRSIFGEKFELRANVRFSEVGDVDLTTGVWDADTLFGVGFGYELIRGLSITGDFEDGQFNSWNIGFRLDLDEN
jgi:hypothetical protein